MAIRLKGEFNTQFDSAYKVEIDDTEYSGSIIDFTTADEGFTLEYQGQNTGRFNPILSSYLTVFMVVENSDHETFLTDIETSKEGQFKVKVTRSGAIVWVGEVLMDTVQEIDTSPNRVFSISCVDGLGKLSQTDYNNNGVAYSGTATILDHLYNIINKTNLPFFYTTENFLKVVCNWYDDAHPYAATLDPLTLTRVNHKVFYSTDKLGVKKYMNCFQVLKNICQLFGAKIIQSGGTLRFEQINERKDTQFTEHIYDKTGTKLSTSTTASNEVTINQSKSFARKTQGFFSKFPPLKEVSLLYKHELSENLLGGVTWDNTSHVNFEVGDFKNDPTRYIFTGSLYFKTTSTLNQGDSVSFRGAFRLKFKWGTYWYSRDAINNNGTVTFGNHFWASSEDYYDLSSQFINIFIDYDPGSNNTFEETRIINISFETPTLSLVQLSGTNTLDIDVELVNLLDNNGDPVNSSIVNLDEWHLNDAKLTLSEGSTSSTEGGRIYTVSNGANTGNSQTINFETVFADGPTANSPGRLEVYNGSDWENSSEWKIDNTGDGYKIQELVIREILSGQTLPVKKYNGTIRGKIDAYSRLTFDSSKWLFIGGTFAANSEEWSGEWFHIAIDDTGIVIDPEEPVPTADPPLGTDPGSGSGLSGGGTPNGVVPTASGVGLTSIGITNGSNISGIPINPIGTGGVISTGDQVQLVDLITGQTQTFTVSSDVSATDTGISVVSTTANNSFAPGSTIVIPTTSLAQSGSSFNTVFVQDDTITDYTIVGDDIRIDSNANAGQGEAGYIIDKDGIRAYGEGDTSPKTEIEHSTGTLKVEGMEFVEESADPTTEGQLKYKDGEFKYHDGTEVKTLQAGASMDSAFYLTFSAIPRGTAWTTGYLNEFLIPGTEINGKSIKKIIFGMSTGPDGTGTTTIITRKNGSSVSTLSIVTPVPSLLNQTLSPSNFTVASNDKIEFEITALSSIPPEGLTIILKIE